MYVQQKVIVRFWHNFPFEAHYCYKLQEVLLLVTVRSYKK